MRPIGLGEHGGVTLFRQDGAWVAQVFYRDFAGRGRRIRRSGRSKAEASRVVLKAVQDALAPATSGQFRATDTLEKASAAWLSMFTGRVERGTRSPSTLDEYRNILNRIVVPGVGALKLGEVSTPRLDHFVQQVLAERGYATAKLTRTVLSGVCGWACASGSVAREPGPRPDSVGVGPRPDGARFVCRGTSPVVGGARR